VAFTREGIGRLYKAPFVEGNGVELLSGGRETFQRIFGAVESARKLLCLEFYIFRNDETGVELSEILKKKAAEGVGVYILYDHVGSFGTPLGFWKALREAGVEVKASHPFSWRHPGGYFHRDHRKLVIIDGHTAFTGGLNIANEYRGIHLRRKEPWRDTGLIVKGPGASALLETFTKAWAHWGGRPFPMPPYAGREGSLPLIPIFASSGRGRRRMRRLLYYSINHAEKEICLTTAYFTPSKRMIETLEAAVKRGVRVRLLVPGESDVPAAYYAGRAFFERLLAAGAEIYNYYGQVLHAKSYVFDRAWSIAGSANLDFQSLRWNDEGNVGILDEGFAGQMLATFEEDLVRSTRISLDEWRRRPFSAKLKERFFSLFRRRL